MTQKNTLELCPVCKGDHISDAHVIDGWAIFINCERCGKFKIDHVLVSINNNQPWHDVRHLVSAWIRRENNAERIPTVAEGVDREYLYTPQWSDQFKHMGFPETTNEKLDALLLAYANSIGSTPGRQFSFGQPHFIADVASRNQEEINGLNDLLDELGLIEKKYPIIKAKGWLRIDELKKKTFISNSAFVAMWFSDVTTMYREAAVASINYCGYKPVIIDQQEYNDFIMNQVISSIKQSRFLVADFTSRPEIENDSKVKNGVRGGVYWEAGMAYGLGRPVLHTCEDNMDSKNRIHFDVNQYNTIYWKEDELSTQIRPLDQTRANPNFAEKLSARILATVGRGSNLPSE